ncbi:cystatin [Bombina bombina]|uniref:cystatin n=1 Tax=Bombina bombina TaxID=8345 RepID=UPI00235ACE29|nr:cystatin [Bombina bombina]
MMAYLRAVSVLVLLSILVQAFAQIKKPTMGGWFEAKEDDQHVQNALQFATEEYNKANNGDYILRVHQTIKLKKKVVSGMMYLMEVDVITTECTNEDSIPEVCPNEENTSKIKRCTFQVLWVPWKNIIELQKSYCR